MVRMGWDRRLGRKRGDSCDHCYCRRLAEVVSDAAERAVDERRRMVAAVAAGTGRSRLRQVTVTASRFQRSAEMVAERLLERVVKQQTTNPAPQLT